MTKQGRSILLLILFLCTSFIFAQKAAEEQKKIPVDYKMGPNDLIEISVFGLEEMTGILRRVSQDGNITLPLLGKVKVEGFTSSELEHKLKNLLEEKWLQNPQVSVFIREFMSKRVSVLGAVQNPGPYELLGRQTVLSIISLAGGLTPDAGNEIIVLRETPEGKSTSIRIPLEELILKGDPRYNIPLEPNDIVNIPVDKIVYIYVLGQVKTPGALQVKRSSIPTLLQAIAQAGGFSERARKSAILIKRLNKEGKEVQIKINATHIIKGKKKDFQLKENDTVFVPETIF
ncbi:MAG: polysaccharide biosynthesis/export family protein [Candidatus Aminicenantales bacterium]